MRLTEEPFYASAVIFQEAGGVCLSGRRRIVENHPQRLISGGEAGGRPTCSYLFLSPFVGYDGVPIMLDACDAYVSGQPGGFYSFADRERCSLYAYLIP